MTNPDDYTELEMATKTIGRVKITTDANGKTKLKRVHKLPAGQRKNLHGKAAAQEKKWRAK